MAKAPETVSVNDQRFLAGQAAFEEITGLRSSEFLDGLKDLEA